MPVHPGSSAVKHLKPVDPEVPRTRRWISGQHQAERNELSPVARPAFHHGKPREVGFGFNLLNVAAPYLLSSHGKQTRGFRKNGKNPLYCRRINLAEYLDQFLADRSGFSAKGKLHSLLRAEEVYHQGKVRSLDVFKQKGGAAFSHGPRRYLRYLKLGGDLGFYSLEIAYAFKMAYKAC